MSDIFSTDGSYEKPYYTASLSPFLQGTEIVQLSQLLNYGFKIRSNTSLATSENKRIPGYQSQESQILPFDDNSTPNNFGTLILTNSQIYTPGRILSSNGVKQNFSSVFSNVNLFSSQRLNTFVSHVIEQRDLGQIENYNDGNPYVEPDIIEKNPAILIEKNPNDVILPISLVLANNISDLNGVIEPLTIRQETDKTSIEMPYIARSIKAGLSLIDEKKESQLFFDYYDTDNQVFQRSATPFLDVQGTSIGSVRSLAQENIFNDQISNISPFIDLSAADAAYPVSKIDSSMRSLLISGVTINGSQYGIPFIDSTPDNIIVARHGFTFSQNENFNYDSIAFGGLKR